MLQTASRRLSCRTFNLDDNTQSCLPCRRSLQWSTVTLFSATCVPTSALWAPSDLCPEGMGGVQGALGSCLDDEGRLEGGELHHSPPQQFWVWLRNNYQQEKKSGRTSLGVPITGAPNALGVADFRLIHHLKSEFNLIRSQSSLK